MKKSDTNLTRRDTLRLGGAAGAGILTTLAGCTGGGGGGTITQSGGGGGSGGGGSGGGSGDGQGLITQSRVGKASASTALDYWLLQDQSHENQENPKLGDVVRNQVYQPWAKEHQNAKLVLRFQTNLEQMKIKLLQSRSKKHRQRNQILRVLSSRDIDFI